MSNLMTITLLEKIAARGYQAMCIVFSDALVDPSDKYSDEELIKITVCLSPCREGSRYWYWIGDGYTSEDGERVARADVIAALAKQQDPDVE